MTYLISNLHRKKGKFVIIIINSVVDPDPNYIGIQQHCGSRLGQKIQDPDPNINVESTVKQFFFNIYKNNFNGAVILEPSVWFLSLSACFSFEIYA